MATKTVSRNGAVPPAVFQSDNRPVMGAAPAMPATITDRLEGVNVTLAQCREVLEAIHARVSGGCKEMGKDAMAPCTNSVLGHVSSAEYHSSDILAQLRELASAIGA